MAGQYIEAMRPATLLHALATPLRRVPSQCAICHGWARQRLCDACTLRYAVPSPRCRRCALGVPEGVEVCGACLTLAPPFAGAIAALDYAYPWDDLVRRFKFDASLDLADALAQRLLDAVRRSGAPRPDWLLPVPLAAERLRERGYNQAWELARRIARDLPCATDPRLLLRMKETPHQLALPPDRRAANVRGAFAVEPRRRHALKDRSVAVLDDVMTTGATASEVAVTLLRAGAHSVQVWVLARTPRPQDA
jgi:ComF family protein